MTCFEQPWFDSNARECWDALLPEHYPGGIGRALEIGSYEGASACYLLGHGVKDLLCVDTWLGSNEPHYRLGVDMAAVHDRFTANTRQAAELSGGMVTAWQMTSVKALTWLHARGEAGQFDFAYVDGSHAQADVLTDGCLALPLVRPGGWVYFDDYEDQWPGVQAAVDALLAAFEGRVQSVQSEHQMHVQVLP